METLQGIGLLLQILFALWILSFPARILWPNSIDFFSRIDEMVVHIFERLVYGVPVALSNVWFASASILYFVGNFAVLLILAYGVFLVGYSIFLHWAQVQFSADGMYQLAKVLVDEKTAWSGVTILVAATVAIGHMWKLNLDKRQYYEKQAKERKEQWEAERAKRGLRLKDFEQ